MLSTHLKPTMAAQGCHDLSRLCGAMHDDSAGDVTAILQATQERPAEAAARLLPLVYAELHKLAQARMAHVAPGSTLQPTALVHEAYLRLVGKADLNLEGRRHFFFAAARAMRDILVEHARAAARRRRGGGRQRVELDESTAACDPPPEYILAVSEALVELEKEDPLKAQIVNLRYFAGMTADEAARVLGISESTLHRHWRFTSAWLRRRLGDSYAPG
ncbi:MAG: ECF-type sigma factor [Opitutales bacterium]